MNSEFGKVIARRRSIYALKKESPISDQAIEDILKHALKYTPTAHNTQLTRLVLLQRGAHDEFWDFVMEAIREAAGPVDLTDSERKIDTFRDGYSTVLFYNDTLETRKMIEEMPLYADQFEKWAGHANAMLQFSVWNMLEEAGFGASLQHYNPIVDERVRQRWNISPDWELMAQMPFGTPYAEPETVKTFLPMEKRFLIHN